MDGIKLWEQVLSQMQFNISRANFVAWFKGTRFLLKKEDKALISVPNHFAKEWLEKKYQKIILKIIHSLDNDIKKVEFVLGKNKSSETNTFFQKIEYQPLFKKLAIDKKTGLNPRYNFENFVVGDFNELAHAAATAVSENPGLVYNPLFIYGKVGLGKTHILQAIGNYVAKIHNEKNPRYLSSERFTEEVISAIRNNTIENFKKEYREFDVLIVDDIQFLAGREKTQDVFFHIFNELYQKNKQIVVSSDRPPKAILSLTERLKSRFEGGMIADITYPDLETRMAILKAKAQEKNIEFLEEIFNYIASNIQTNIRELEGALNKILLMKKGGKPIEMETIKSMFGKTNVPMQKINSNKIIQTVAEFYDISEKDILSQKRTKEIVRPRQIAMYLLRKELNASFPYIAKKFRGKDHTTVMYAVQKISQSLKNEEIIERDLNLIKMRFSGV